VAETHEVSRREFKKLMCRAGEGIFLVTVSTVFVCLYLTISPVLCPFVTSVF